MFINGRHYLLVYLPFFSAGTDYTGGSFNVVIPASTTKVTVPVATLDDNLLEDDEFFKATLTIPDAPADVVVGSPNMAFVNITDGDCKLYMMINIQTCTYVCIPGILYNHISITIPFCTLQP